MPAWPKLRIPLLHEVAEQLRYAPKSAVLKDIQRTIETIQLLDPLTDYPADWVAFRITGYRADQAFDAISGAALAPQLARLVERLSAQSRLAADDLDAFGPGLSQESLLERWNISRKTLERYRGKGLVALRVLSSRGRSALFFPRSTTEAFESANRPALERAGAFRRVSETERANLRDRAARLRRKTTVTRSRIAAHLSKRAGRSRSAVERAMPPLKRSERRPRLSSKARLALLAKWESGVGAGELARQARKSRAAIIHSINTERKNRLERWDASTRLPHDHTAVGADSFAALGARYRLASVVVQPRAEADAESLLEAMGTREIPDRERERELTLAHHACMRLAAAMRANSADELDLAETALRWASKLRAALVRPYRAIVVESLEAVIGERFGISAGIEPLRSEPALLVGALFRGIQGAALAIEGFTPDSSNRRGIGGNLAGPISLAVGRALSDWAKSHDRDIQQLRGKQSSRAAKAIGAIDDWTDHASPWQAMLSPVSLRAKHDGAQASPPQPASQSAELLRLRYGLGATRPHTIGEIAASLRTTRIRAAAQVQAALRAGI